MSEYEVVGGMLAEWTDQCTCGSPVNQGFPHERGCGLEPVGPVDQLLADLAELDRLRARVAELESVGDELADAAHWALIVGDPTDLQRLNRLHHKWRAVRSDQ